MKIAVTGATGFLGEHLCLKLRQLGHELFEYNSKNLDLSKPITLPNSIDVLYHLAANARVQWAKKDPFADFKINALGTLNVLESVRKSSIKKIIYVSSCLVYKELIDSNEKDAVGTNEISGPYGISKLVGEYYIKEYAKIYGIDYVILRPTGFYGPGMKKNAIFDIIEGILNKGKIQLFHHIDSQFDFIYIEDAIEALIMSLDWSNEVINVSSGESVSLRTLYNLINTILGREVSLEYAGELVKISVNNHKLRNLGWCQKYSLEEGLKKTVESFKIVN